MEVLNIETNEFLEHKVKAYYHGFHKGWNNSQVKYINTLKNDGGVFNNHKRDFGYTLSEAQTELNKVLEKDLPVIAKSSPHKLTICVVPRSKCNKEYVQNQLLFISTIKNFVKNNLDKFNDGTEYVERVTDTPTTHTTKNYESVKVGITKKTCYISNDVQGKDILLIDDIYTKSVNIDEDAIQALYDKGANSVIFYAIGNTM